MGGKGSLTLVRFRGIPVRLHFTFLIILPYLAWVIGRTTPMLARLSGVNPADLVAPHLLLGTALAISLFVCVLVHEFAHVIVGVRGGAKVEGVTLMIVGGVSEISELPRRPLSEAAMAAAGPLASFLIALLAYGGYRALGSSVPDARFALHYLAYMNLALAIFNMIPAFPMDGGRILRAVLAMVTNRVRATHVAAWVGQGIAAVLLVGGLLSLNWVLVLIGILVVAGARAEFEMVKSNAVLEGLKVEQAMLRFPPTVNADDGLAFVLDRMQRELKTAYFVISQGELVGAISSQDAQRGVDARSFSRVADLMRTDLPLLAPEQSLMSAARLLRTSGFDTLPVVQDKGLVGSVSFTTIAATVRAREAERASEPTPPRRREAT